MNDSTETWTCSNGHDSPTEYKFCAFCGEAAPAPTAPPPVADRRCSQGHPIGPDDRYCPDCGEPSLPVAAPPSPPASVVAQTQPPPPPAPPSVSVEVIEPAAKRRMPRVVILIAMAAALVLAAGVAIAASIGRAQHQRDNNQDSAADASDFNDEEPPVPAMWDRATSGADVVASIKSDYCASQIYTQQMKSLGFTLIQCFDSQKNSTAFWVYESAAAFDSALSQGIDCGPHDWILVGPTWVAFPSGPSVPSVLLQGGATQTPCY